MNPLIFVSRLEEYQGGREAREEKKTLKPIAQNPNNNKGVLLVSEREKGNNVSRREFLKDAGLIVGGATVGSMALLNACGAETKTVTSTVSAPAVTVTAPAPTITRLIEKAGASQVEVTVNGYKATVQVEPHETLAEMLRERMNLTGTKVGCDRGACGACVVHLDGKPVLSCMTLAIEVGGRFITTIEGLADKGKLHPLQQAVYDHTGFQCGFCTPGVIMETRALLDEKPKPTVEEIKAALGGHICRCGSFYAFIESVQIATGGKS